MIRQTINPESFSARELAQAVQILREDGVVAYPTETVYGLGASMLSAHAVDRIFEIKGRESGKPISLMIAGLDMLNSLCYEITDQAAHLIEAFWPGPLTLVFLASEQLPDYLRNESGTVGIRFPKHELSTELVRLLGAPITSTSANRSGQPAASDAVQVAAQLGGRVDCLIDGGICSGKIPSTVVDVTGAAPKLLRQGAIAFSEIELRVKGIRI